MKKAVSLILALVMCLAIIPMTANAEIEGNYKLRWDMGSTNNNPAYVE